MDPLASDSIATAETVLVTGFPAFTARRLIAKIVRTEETSQIYVLARDRFARAATQFIESLGAAGGRAKVLVGDVCDMDLGLAGSEYGELANSVTSIYHLAGIYYTGVDRKTAQRVNVDGTRGMIELAGEAGRLRRMSHFSTAAVAGRRRGVVLEEELDVGQSFHNFWEETKFEAEKLMRAAQRGLPITVFRPGTIVGDSRTGEIDKFDGPYRLIVLLLQSELPMRLPLPGSGTAPLHLVPIDYVIDALYALSKNPAAAGATLHITDPNPFAAKKVFELVAEFAQKKPPRGVALPGAITQLLRAPGIRRLTHTPRSFLEALSQQCMFNNRHTTALLRGTGLRCPTFDEYAEALVRYVVESKSADTQSGDDTFDPFD